EARAIDASYRERIIRYGEHGTDAMREKAHFVLEEITRRLGLFGVGWRDTTACQVYTIRDIYLFFVDEIVRRGAAHAGINWHFTRPPVRDLEFEGDCRGVRGEEVIWGGSASPEGRGRRRAEGAGGGGVLGLWRGRYPLTRRHPTSPASGEIGLGATSPQRGEVKSARPNANAHDDIAD